jgi:hypothetical protein
LVSVFQNRSSLGTIHIKWGQERLCLTVQYYSSNEFEITLNFYWNGVEAAGILYRPCHLGVPFFEGVLFAGGIVYVNVLMGYSEGHSGKSA